MNAGDILRRVSENVVVTIDREDLAPLLEAAEEITPRALPSLE